MIRGWYQHMISIWSAYYQHIIIRISSAYYQHILSAYDQHIIRISSGYHQHIIRILSAYHQHIIRILSHKGSKKSVEPPTNKASTRNWLPFDAFSTNIRCMNIITVVIFIIIIIIIIIPTISGINTIMYYSATVVQMAGIGSASSAIWITAVIINVSDNTLASLTMIKTASSAIWITAVMMFMKISLTMMIQTCWWP